jgi:glycerol-3-phosphate acyltransferase PlsY
MGVTTLAVGAMSLLLVWRHRANIEKLMAGKETRLGAKARP